MLDYFKKHKKSAISILVALSLIAGLYQDFFSPLYQWAFDEDDIELEEINIDNEELIIHVLPNDIDVDVTVMNETGFPDYYETELTIQARKAPILLNNKVVLLSQDFNQNFFSEDIHLYGDNLEIIKVESSDISIENVGETVIIKLLLKPTFFFPETRCIVYERCENAIVGGIEIELFYTYNNLEKSLIIDVPIRFI